MTTAANGGLGKILLTASRLRDRVRELGQEITRDYTDKDLVLLGVLNGAAFFTVDLARAIHLPLQMDWVAVSTYGMGSTAGTIRLRKDVYIDLKGRHILVVEDILDTGRTLHWLMNRLATHSPASVECCVLIRKPQALVKPISAKYVGFDIDARWVAGYGIDYAELYRNQPQVHEVLLG